MASGVPSNFDKKLRGAVSRASRSRSRSASKNFNSTQQPIRRKSMSRNSLNMSSKNMTRDESPITNITVRKRSVGGIKKNMLVDTISKSKSPISSKRQSCATSKNAAVRSLLPPGNQARKKSKERKSSKSATRKVTRSKSNGNKMRKV